MVGGDHHHVVLPQSGQERAQPAVELRQGGGVAVDVPAVAVEHVKIHQIHEAQPVKIPCGIVHRVRHAVSVGLVEHVLRVPPSGENVVDLAHGQAVQPRRLYGVQHGLLRRLQRKVVTVGRALEAVLRVAHIGAGDHPADAILSLQNLPRLAAGIVQLLQGNPFLVRRHLKHGIGGGVDDPLAGLALLLAVVPDDVGAGIGQVAQDAPAGLLLEGVQNLFGEAVGEGGQGLGGDHTGDFPMADGGVLAHGAFPQPGERAGGGGGLRQAGHAVDVAQSRGGHVGNVQLLGGGAGTQGIDPHVPEGLRVGHRADAEGIQNNQKYSLHTITLYEFLIKRLKAFYSAAGLRPAATAAKKRSQYISYRRPGGLP